MTDHQLGCPGATPGEAEFLCVSSLIVLIFLRQTIRPGLFRSTVLVGGPELWGQTPLFHILSWIEYDFLYLLVYTGLIMVITDKVDPAILHPRVQIIIPVVAPSGMLIVYILYWPAAGESGKLLGLQ